MENVRKDKNIKLVTTERRRNYLVSGPSYHTTKFFPENLGLPILDLSKTVIYEFRQNYVKPKYGENPRLCYKDTDSFMVHAKTDDIYKDIAKDFQTRFNTSNFKLDRPLPKGNE